MIDPNPQKEDGHLQIANTVWLALAKRRLQDYERRIIMSIIYRTWGFNKVSAEIRNKQIVKDSGVPKQKVTEIMKNLISKKIVTQSGNKIKFNKVYTQWEKELPRQVTSYPASEQELPSQVTLVTQPVSISRCVKTPLKDTSKRQSIEQAFEKFWKAWPKKVDRKEAYQKFLKVKEPVEVLLSAIERQKKSQQWEEKKYIPSPARWLSKEKWEDEVIVEQKSQTKIKLDDGTYLNL